MRIFPILSLLLLTVGCSDEFSQTSLKRQNQKGEYISRQEHERLFQLAAPKPKAPPSYSWDKRRIGGLPKITKEFFRCKGSALNPEIIVEAEGKKIRDCGGSDKHGLPLREGKEFIYPIMVDLLNAIQEKSGRRVVITSGHRCPAHNDYINAEKPNIYSKHMVGAEVSFYVQGLELSPERVAAMLKDYYANHDDDSYRQFQRYSGKTDVSTTPEYNKEIFIKIFKRDEGRNFDNRHPYPYLSLQVRYDSRKQEKVNYNWDHAYRGYLRY